MNAKITVTLHENEKLALIELAQREERDPRAQAALIIRSELQRLGYLQSPTNLPAKEEKSTI